MTIRVLPYPSAHAKGTSVGIDFMYAAAVPRIGDHIRVDAQLDTGGVLVISGPVTKIETHLGSAPDETYVIIYFDPIAE